MTHIKDDDLSYQADVYTAVAAGLRNYAAAVARNTGNVTDTMQAKSCDMEPSSTEELALHLSQSAYVDDVVFDDLEAKVAAYDSACQLVSQLIQTDCDIVNGAQSSVVGACVL